MLSRIDLRGRRLNTAELRGAMPRGVADVDSVKPHPKNARRGDVAAIAESMRVNGVYRPVIAQRKTGYILAGNHTWAAMRQAGCAQVPVVLVDVDTATAEGVAEREAPRGEGGQGVRGGGGRASSVEPRVLSGRESPPAVPVLLQLRREDLGVRPRPRRGRRRHLERRPIVKC